MGKKTYNREEVKQELVELIGNFFLLIGLIGIFINEFTVLEISSNMLLCAFCAVAVLVFLLGYKKEFFEKFCGIIFSVFFMSSIVLFLLYISGDRFFSYFKDEMGVTQIIIMLVISEIANMISTLYKKKSFVRSLGETFVNIAMWLSVAIIFCVIQRFIFCDDILNLIIVLSVALVMSIVIIVIICFSEALKDE